MTTEEKRLEIASRNLAAILTNDYWLRWLHQDVEMAIGDDKSDFRAMWIAKRSAEMALLHADALLVEVAKPTRYVEPLEEFPEGPEESVSV